MGRTLGAVIAPLLLASVAFAATSNTNANNLSTTLQVQATVQTAITFSLATDSCVKTGDAAGGNTTDYHITFGNVDGLGLGTGAAAGCTPTKTQVPGGYLYAVPYSYTVHFSGFNPTSPAPKLLAYYTPSASQESAVQVWEGTTAANGTHLSADSASPTSLATAMATGATGNRYIGLYVAEYNGANALPGASNPSATDTTTYTTTVTFVVAPD